MNGPGNPYPGRISSSLARVLGCLGVLIPGVAFLVAIPVLLPNDEEEGSAAIVFALVFTLTTWALAIASRWRRASSLAAGLLLGYAGWVVLFILWFSSGP